MPNKKELTDKEFREFVMGTLKRIERKVDAMKPNHVKKAEEEISDMKRKRCLERAFSS
jgi:hypothetical protein